MFVYQMPTNFHRWPVDRYNDGSYVRDRCGLYPWGKSFTFLATQTIGVLLGLRIAVVIVDKVVCN